MTTQLDSEVQRVLDPCMDLAEGQLLTCWLRLRVAETLVLRAEGVDLDTSFSCHGLDSSTAVSLSGDLSNWLEVPIDPSITYDYPTIRQLVCALVEDPATNRALRQKLRTQ